MKSLLFILSLMTGCERMSEGASCEEEWVKFIFNQKTNGRFQMEKVVNLPQKNKINPGKLIVKQLNNADNNRKQSYETEFEVDKDGCPKPFYQTAYRNNNTTITCDSPDGKYKPAFFCKADNSTCQNVLPRNPSPQPNWRIISTNTSSSISISHVSSQDAGVYWCGVKSGDKEFLLRQIHLEVKDGLEVIICVTVSVAVLLLFLIALILIYKRNGAAGRHVKEDRICEERQENLQKPENAVNSISVRANNPINHTASPHYAAINFQVRSEKAGGGILKPSSAACEYSAVKFSKCPDDLTVTQPHRLVK